MEKEENKQQQQENKDITQNKYFWVIGSALLLLVGFFSWKLIFGSDEDYRVSLVDFPRQINAGNNLAFTWRVDGPPSVINHTSVRYGLESNPGELNRDIKPTDTKYTDFVKDFADGKYNVPLQFIGNTKITKPGKYYFRVYAFIKEKNYWSDEYSLEVKVPSDYKVSIVNTTKNITVGQTATFTWYVDGSPIEINQTSVYFGQASVSGILDKNVKPSNTKYTNMVKDFANGKYNIPLQFVGNAEIATPGSYFYRAHALINGKNYWSNEDVFEVK